MTNTVVPYSNVGQASFEKLDNWTQNFLLAGGEPEVWTYSFTVAVSQTLVMGQVVGVDGSGHLIPAVLGTTPAIGIMTQPVVTGAGDSTFSVPVYLSGSFNVNALTFDATYNTAAKKLAAFNGAPTPTQITLKARPVGNPPA
jgi:hypothetical protein